LECRALEIVGTRDGSDVTGLCCETEDGRPFVTRSKQRGIAPKKSVSMRMRSMDRIRRICSRPLY
jgi:hypothetical protein